MAWSPEMNFRHRVAPGGTGPGMCGGVVCEGCCLDLGGVALQPRLCKTTTIIPGPSSAWRDTGLWLAHAQLCPFWPGVLPSLHTLWAAEHSLPLARPLESGAPHCDSDWGRAVGAKALMSTRVCLIDSVNQTPRDESGTRGLHSWAVTISGLPCQPGRSPGVPPDWASGKSGCGCCASTDSAIF